MHDVIIIGAGAVGSFIARSLSAYKLHTLVIEKETDVGDVTSMANSAIAHSGYDPVPGTNKAKFNVLGNKMMPEVCKDLDVEFEMNGTLTLALYEEQLPMLKELSERAKLNGVEAHILSPKEVLEREPNITKDVKGALFCPTGGIVNPFTLTSHAMENAMDNGVELHLMEAVLNVEDKGDHFVVKTSKAEYEAKVVINAAGLSSDKFAKMMDDISWHITPRKGQYYVLNHFDKDLPGKKFVNAVVFPLPSEKGKGILVSRTTSGNYIVGPSSEPVDDIGDVSTDSMTLANVKAQATAMVPGIPFGEQIRVYAGNRSTPSNHDFIIEPSKNHPHFINVAGIESPGLVSSPAIGKYVAKELVYPILKPEKNPNFKKTIKPYIRPLTLSLEERNALIKKNPDYGEMVCNCERVSLGEIEDALNRSLPCMTVKALKKRTRAGFGKCQGGFCQPNVIRLLAERYGVSPMEVLYDKENSEIVLSKAMKGAK